MAWLNLTVNVLEREILEEEENISGETCVTFNSDFLPSLLFVHGIS